MQKNIAFVIQSYSCLFSDLEIAVGEPRNADWNILSEHNYFKSQGDILLTEEGNIESNHIAVDIVLEQPSCSLTINVKEAQTCNDNHEAAINVQTSAPTKRKPLSKQKYLVKQILTISRNSVTNSTRENLQQAQQILPSPASYRNMPELL